MKKAKIRVEDLTDFYDFIDFMSLIEISRKFKKLKLRRNVFSLNVVFCSISRIIRFDLLKYSQGHSER